jgi:7-cyano-7-deazaguanine synthase
MPFTGSAKSELANNANMTKAIVVFSGGPDSTAAALWAVENGYTPHLLTFNFKGAKQYGELLASMLVAKELGLCHTIIDFQSVMSSFDPNISILMHAGVQTGAKGDAKPHRLPFGAGMILSTASAFALYHNITTVIWGATKSDRLGGNYDYGQEFASDNAKLISQTSNTNFSILVPFNDLHKPSVLKTFLGKEELFSKTWSCKGEGSVQAGDTKACIARRIAAKAIGLQDLTAYQQDTYPSPLTEVQIANIESLSDEDLSRLFDSPLE